MKKLIEDRIKKMRDSFSDHNIDTFMVILEENRTYLSGFKGEDLQFDEYAGVLLINKTKLILATDSRYVNQAKKEAPLYEIYCYKDFSKELPVLLDTLNTRRLGFESMRVSQFLFNEIEEQLKLSGLNVKLIAIKDLVESFRIIKDKDEIEITKRSIRIAEAAFENLLKILQPGMTEKDAAWKMEKNIRENGAKSLSFPIIVACGENGALPHYSPGEIKIKEGEPVLFDWGAKFKGYCSDISRTVFIGKPDANFIKIYTTVLDAQRKAIDEIKPGISSKRVFEVAYNYIEGTEFKGKFKHGLGHGTGLNIHENPRLASNFETILKPGMIFTVEPGIYIEKWGGVRLENQVAVTDDGFEVLNKLKFLNI